MPAYKRISIVVPIYNAARTLAQTLDSICCQTLGCDEIILIDDCSSDASLSLCNDFAEKFPDRVRIISATQRRGPSASRNVGTEMASGEYICYVDSDDILISGALDILYEFAKRCGCDMVQAGCYYLCGDKLLVRKGYKKRYEGGKVFSAGQAMKSLVANDFISNFAWGKLYKTEIAKRHRFREDIDMGEDAFWQHLVINDCARIGVLPAPLYIYRQNSDGLSWHFSPRHMGLLKAGEERLGFLKQYYPELMAAHLSSYWHTAYSLYRSAKFSDEDTEKLFSKYLESLMSEYREDLDKALKFDMQYLLYKYIPSALPVYLQAKRVSAFVRRKLGFSEFEHIAYSEQ